MGRLTFGNFNALKLRFDAKITLLRDDNQGYKGALRLLHRYTNGGRKHET